MLCPSLWVHFSKWLNHFFTHIHEYDKDYSRALLELLPHCLKQKDTHAPSVIRFCPASKDTQVNPSLFMD
ncbi:MAG: hypothetical protein PUD52_07195 [Prevotella sp.]|nr:hypothetical protein [Prevotella sp.]